MIASWAVLDEEITWMALLGAAMVLLGMYSAEKYKKVG
jgi:drug/metabolite transporter (DMT)-like permease